MLTKDSIELWSTRRTFADTALLATTTVALMVSLVVAATVVSIGIARADAFGDVAGGNSGRRATAAVLAFPVADMGRLAIAAIASGWHLRPRNQTGAEPGSGAG